LSDDWLTCYERNTTSRFSSEMNASTLFDKIWKSRTVVQRDDGQSLLYVDRHYCHEGSAQPFRQLAAAGRGVRRPDRTFGVADHYVPTRGYPSAAAGDPEILEMVRTFSANMAAASIPHFGPAHADMGIVHVTGPEQGLTLPGTLIVCGDSHTSTHGALGALAFGIGASEVAHVLATQTLWQLKPRNMRIDIPTPLPAHADAKDLMLALIARIGTGGASGHAIEFTGAGVLAMSVEERLTLCNMAIEAGARSALVAPDDRTFNYLAGRKYAPSAAAWDEALARWRQLATDPAALYDRTVHVDSATLEPMATWGTSPEEALALDAALPRLDDIPDPSRRAAVERSLAYMGLEQGMPMRQIAFDQVFIGSCTNARIEDLRKAAAVVRGRQARLPAVVSPGSMQVRRQAEAEGLDRDFIAAGFEWRNPGCSMCAGMNGDIVAAGKRCASTSNRNFPGRQGRGSRTHLVSPSTAAAVAITGHLVDAREVAGCERGA